MSVGASDISFFGVSRAKKNAYKRTNSLFDKLISRIYKKKKFKRLKVIKMYTTRFGIRSTKPVPFCKKKKYKYWSYPTAQRTMS